MNTTDKFRQLWDAGYHRLVPVVPPKAELHERSSLHARLVVGDDARGKAPGTRNSDGKWRGMNYVAMEAHEEDLPSWGETGASVGIKTGDGLVALDIDTTDRQAAEQLYTLAAEILGPAAVRFGRKPKCLMLYEAPQDTTYQQVVFSTPSEDAARVELLSEGRQFVAQGEHPVTGKPYAWPQGIPRRDQLTRVTADQIEQFMQEAAAKLPNSRRGAERGSGEAPDQETLKAPDWDTLEKTVEAIPNTSAMFPERDDYVTMAYAIKAAAPEGYEHSALDLFLDWCERWQDGENDQEIAMADWGRAKPPFRAGYGFLRSRAVNLFFEAVSPQEADEAADMFREAAKQQDDGPRKLEILFRDDIRNLKAPQFVIERHIPEQSMGFLYGAPGCGKSFMALDMGMHVAYGRQDWHEDAINSKEDGWVIYLAREGSAGFRARIQAWENSHLLPEDRPCRFALIRENLNFMQQKDVTAIVDTVKSAGLENIALIVVDTVSRVLPGADENLQKEMTLFVKACDALQHAFDCVVLGVHHSGKSGDMRGSSVLKGAGDFVFKLEKSKHNPKFVNLHCEKQKDTEDGWANTYALNTVSVGEDRSSLVPERVQGGPEADEMNPALADLLLGRIDAAWAEGQPLSKAPQAKGRYAPQVLSSMFGVSADLIKQALEMWEQTGQIVYEKVDTSTHRKGFRIVRDSEETDDASASQSVFG